MNAIAIKPLADYERLITALALKVYRRAIAAGHRSIDLDDVKQEMRITYLNAVKKFDAAKGIAFTTYFQRAAYQNANRWLVRMTETDSPVLSLDWSYGADDEEDVSLAAYVADQRPTADKLFEEEQLLNRVMERLSPRARQFLNFVVNPPPELFRAVEALQGRAEYGRSIGLAAGSPPARPTMHMIGRFMGLSPTIRTRICREITVAAGKVNRGRK